MNASNNPSICIVCGQIAGFGRIGGFGVMARNLAEALRRAGHPVSVCVLKTADLKSEQMLGDIPVRALPPAAFFLGSSEFAKIKADIYHSQEPTLGTYRMQQAHPGAKHVVTCIDPRDDMDWAEEFRRFSLKKKLLYPAIRGFEDSTRVRKSVARADKVICQTKFIIPKVQRMYNPPETPMFIGHVASVPDQLPTKAEKPTVCFLARLDRRKRPELFFQMAERFPGIDFITIGKAHDPQWDKELRDRFGNVPNLKMLGYVDPYKSNLIQQTLQKSWILINTASREGLPAAFVEAASYGCAILATVNPDEFASSFGYYTDDPAKLDDGLNWLLQDGKWRELGKRGHAYVSEHFSESSVVAQHQAVYHDLLAHGK
jgi:glycosyltransferase involved in cell wall biosynthesis